MALLWENMSALAACVPAWLNALSNTKPIKNPAAFRAGYFFAFFCPAGLAFKKHFENSSNQLWWFHAIYLQINSPRFLFQQFLSSRRPTMRRAAPMSTDQTQNGKNSRTSRTPNPARMAPLHRRIWNLPIISSLLSPAVSSYSIVLQIYAFWHNKSPRLPAETSLFIFCCFTCAQLKKRRVSAVF